MTDESAPTPTATYTAEFTSEAVETAAVESTDAGLQATSSSGATEGAGDVLLTITPMEYLSLIHSDNEPYYQVSIQPGQSFILGDVALVGNAVTFDRVNMRIGFTRTTDCSEYAALLSQQ